MIVIDDRTRLPDDELEVSYARSGGPGGQNVNKVNSKALLRWRFASSTALSYGARARFREAYASRITVDGDVVVQSDEHRDQAQNLSACEDKLRAMIQAVLVPPKPRRKTKPTKGSKERRLKAKQARGTTKQGRGRVSSDD
jgi:ribosome-associated protein